MTTEQFSQWQNIAWKSGVAAAVSILFTSLYFAIILPAFGFTFDMLDDEVASIQWLLDKDTTGLYQGLMILYFISQLFLLPLPLAMHKVIANNTNNVYSICFAFIGSVGIILSMSGPIFLFANIPELMRTVKEGAIPMEVIVMASNMFADLTKDFRLFSEILMGIWLIGFGFSISKTSASRLKSKIVGFLGLFIFIIPAIKLIDPYMAPEDYIGLVLGACFILLSMIAYEHKREHVNS